NILFFIVIIGILTCFISSIIGLVQFDIKKIIAYSTCSQLGYMIFSCGCSNYNLAFFHLFNHAFFKALLFLLYGRLIVIFNGEQDIRNMFLNIIYFPYYFIILFIGSASLIGLPFFSGFYSKELIIENIFSTFIVNNFFVF